MVSLTIVILRVFHLDSQRFTIDDFCLQQDSFNRVDNTIESSNFSISHKITFIGFRKCLNVIRIRKYTLGQDFKGLIAQI